MDLFKFKPILKQTIWGGNRICRMKNIHAESEDIGESWEISGVKGNESVVDGGQHNGTGLNTLVAELKEKLVGRDNYKRFGNEFPILVKFIDASRDLSIQVHPDDMTARRHGHDKGKTEMWFVMESDPDASLMCGMKDNVNADMYKDMVENGTICNAIAEYKVKEGDCFFIPAGRIHSIGKGCLLAEIQQTSDLTYRIFDFNRRDSNGNLRQLHTSLAAECIDFKVQDNYRTAYTETKNEGVPLVDCEYFSTAVYNLDEPMTIDYSELDSFVVMVCVKGSCIIRSGSGCTAALSMGESLLIAASADEINIEGCCKLIEAYCI